MGPPFGATLLDVGCEDMGKRKAHIRKEHNHKFWVGAKDSDNRHLENRVVPEIQVKESKEIKRTKIKDEIYIFIYDTQAASDYHQGFTTIAEFFTKLLTMPCLECWDEFTRAATILRFAIKHSNMVNDYREDPYLFYVPYKGLLECCPPAICVLIKCDNNGNTFLYSTEPLKDFEDFFLRTVKVEVSI